ncbi:GNAT family N-acetyltransferase [Bacillus alveayuensis]|uniref:GNAT family N-acetyltransferase n=1 Tax=Aeribacillus alveayuensis TaxID=279215 RepID=UPI002285ED37|nr:GNAT family N-acetyltransferase [Bacillus alveayuensis]
MEHVPGATKNKQPRIVNEQHEMEIGYLLVREHWGKGLATEAAKASRDFRFNNYSLHLLDFIYFKNIIY